MIEDVLEVTNQLLFQPASAKTLRKLKDASGHESETSSPKVDLKEESKTEEAVKNIRVPSASSTGLIRPITGAAEKTRQRILAHKAA